MNAIAALILKAAKAAYAADRANVYINPTQFDFDIKIRVPAVNAKYWRFTPSNDGETTHVSLKAYGRKDDHGIVICDGATGGYDGFKGVKKSAGIHDPGHLDIDFIADQWKNEIFDPGPNLKRDWFMRKSLTWTREDVRLLFDAMFGDSIRKLGGSPVVERVYYNVVRYAGGIFHALSSRGITLPDRLPIAIIASALLASAGCTSCLQTPDIIKTPYNGPDIQSANSVTNTTPVIQ